MALLYADEDFPFPAVEYLRALGHDVLTVEEAGRKGTDDPSQLAFASAAGRAILTHNRRDYIRLHRQITSHGGIIACTRDNDSLALADRIHQAISGLASLDSQLIRITRGP